MMVLMNKSKKNNNFVNNFRLTFLFSVLVVNFN